ncbi:MAG: hypothetical protein JWN02_80 [Acidobacteria bacterium]|nr:hypothetical protein [Acidobacteriota bacterium]
MTEEPEIQAVESTDSPGGPPLSTTTITHYQRVAAEALRLIDALRAVIPEVEVPAGLKLDSGTPILKEEFLAGAQAMYDHSTDLHTLPMLDLSTVGDTLQYMEAFRPVILRLQAEILNLKLQFKVRKAGAARAALIVYGAAKLISRAAPGIDLDLGLRNLKSHLPRSKKTRQRTTPSTTPPDDGQNGPASP